MIRPRPAVALLALALSVPAASVHAQTGAGVVAGIRSVSGASGAQGDGTQDGIELRGLLERPIRAGGSTTPSWRIELAYTQLQKPREDVLGRYSVNENGFELGASLRVPVRVALAQAYLLAGPVLSYRAACGVDSHFDSNGRVPCEGERTSAAGAAAGVGVRGIAGDRLDWIGEVRLMRGTVNAAGGTLLAIGVGFQRR
ncbi:MAG: outer membrane beta-barrel protein [Gemmatimonadota bacterium]|nr:outer membrane beta-barrel protein [Gemmatimonadota bacterium]MDQ8148149.1 outer membrane beta-barrel protein [Gemmatimonadota bacterium]MDQ8149846.1 outer membrane beta-barrel protein [Gemmatimonadota bacterium]MDQ8156720.1 outer membrane beta-barrel protein [Gemmatimonadota bacterium]MDQ8177489.1 outer membrane beta-barrel protein [Gemmatimonadota bacterium]